MKLALKTVESVTGVNVNYLIVVDFSGFTRLVNAFGGVYVPVDQYYYHVNTPGTEQYAQIDIKPGYQLLHGTDALAYARYRHTDSDFYRNARQQTFLQAFQARASEKLHGIGIDRDRHLQGRRRDDRRQRPGDRPQRAAQRADDDLLRDAGLREPRARRLVAAGRRSAGMIGDASVVTATPEDMHTAVYAFSTRSRWPSRRVPTGKKPAQARRSSSRRSTRPASR